jgi:NADH-quinone oxidoreductase subunit L
MLYGTYFGASIAESETMAELAKEFHGAGAMVIHSLTSIPFWLAVGGAATAYLCYIVRPDLPAKIRAKAGILVTILERKYYFDDFNDWFFAGGARALGGALFQWGDRTIIDGIMVNGTAKVIGWAAGVVRRLQTGYIYHYAFTMIIGLIGFMTYWYFFGIKVLR